MCCRVQDVYCIGLVAFFGGETQRVSKQEARTGRRMGKSTELMQLLKTGNSDAARKLISKLKKSGKPAQLVAI